VLEREMGAAYPELTRARRRGACLKQEEERFAETLANGMSLLEGPSESQGQ
jgi:alanyl-tRNA synthetase